MIKTRSTIIGAGLALAVALSIMSASAASRGDCLSRIPVLRGYPTQGGTSTVHPGIVADCVMYLPGGAVLRASGATAPPPFGRAIFRISGSGLYGPGGVNIVATASITDTPSAPELLPALHADAIVSLPPNTVLVRFDPGSGRFVAVPSGHIRRAGLYKVLRRGAPPVPPPAPPPMPTALPATGGSPFGVMLAAAGALVLAGLWLARESMPWRRAFRSPVQPVLIRHRLGSASLAGGILLIAATGLTYVYAVTRAAPLTFGTFTDVPEPTPLIGGASGPPTRLVIRKLGIDVPVVSLDVAGGAWQVPAFAAGYLSGGARPGRRGNVTLTGHDDRDGAVFRRLGDVRPGDVMRVYAGKSMYRYAVVALRVVPDTRISVLRPTRGAVLTLITCYPYLIDTQRLVVRARLLQ